MRIIQKLLCLKPIGIIPAMNKNAAYLLKLNKPNTRYFSYGYLLNPFNLVWDEEQVEPKLC